MFHYVLMLITMFLVGPQEEVQKPYVVVYPIQDLEMVIPNFDNAPQLDLNAVLSGNHQGSPFTNTNNQSSFQKKDPKAIINLIETFVESEAWEDNGGDEATIRYWNGNLIIKAPKRIHDQLK